MTPSPAHKPTINFFTTAILLFGGSFSGTHLTDMVAPYSQWSSVVGFTMFPAAFMSGMRLWPWVGLLIQSPRSLAKPANPRPAKPLRHTTGSFTFVITSIAASTSACFFLVPPSIRVTINPGCEKFFFLAGTTYGVICWMLVQLGYLYGANTYPKDTL